MLNLIVWNGTVIDFETVLTLNWIAIYRIVLTFNYALTKSVLILKWISWIRTVWMCNICTWVMLFEIINEKYKY